MNAPSPKPVLPPTVNFHVIRACNYDCRFCFATFTYSQNLLPLEKAKALIGLLPRHGAQKLTFAGGEPTLHPHLAELLEHASSVGLVTCVVTNASRIDGAWLDRHGPSLRWLAISIDSIEADVAARIGRQPRRGEIEHLANVRKVCALVHDWNRRRPPSRRIRLKMNIVVTSANEHEDPSKFLRACRPERIKLLQMLQVEGENDHATDLLCSDDAFAAYAARVRRLEPEGMLVVAETCEQLCESYAMLNPEGRFYQRDDQGKDNVGPPVLEVGVEGAFAAVGGYSPERFADRGGDYEPGEVASGNRPWLIAIEGLDGCGKSTVAAALAKALDADLVGCPPESVRAERALADAMPEPERRARYHAWNRTATELANTLRSSGRVVVMDRSPASTLAYGAAHESREAACADWPPQLDRPDLLVVLEVPEPVRVARLASRSNLTAEERRLVADDAFRARVLGGYRNLGGLTLGGSVDEIVAAIRALLR